MKAIKASLMMMLALLAFASCSSNSDDDSQMKNYVTLSVAGEPSLFEDDAQGVTVNITMAQTLSEDVTVNLALQGDDKGAVKLSSNTAVIKAGEKSASVQVLSNNKSVLLTQEVVTVVATSFSNANMQALDAKGVNVTVKPVAGMPALTEEQLALIEGYKQNLGIDLMKVLGVLDVKTTITFGNDDKDLENNGEDTRSFTGKTIVTLSENATEKQPILKMISNPLGMTSFMYEKLRRCTAEDPDEYFMGDPISAAVFGVSNYNFAQETFEVTLDDIAFNADGTISFVGTEVDEEYQTTTDKVLFDYNYSVWNRLSDMAQTGKQVVVDEGDTQTEYDLLDLLTQYNTFNPAYYLGNSSVTEDAYGYDPSNFIEPQAYFDLGANKMSFNFSWDYGAGGILYDYVRVHVDYTLHK